MPLFSRLGPYPTGLLDELTAHTSGPVRREMFEYWGHMASLMPMRLYPLFRWRMDRAHRESWGGMQRLARERPDFVEQVRLMVADQGPIRSGQTGAKAPVRRPGEMWNWHDGKVALEYLFWSGAVTAARRVNFERHYDVPERVIPVGVVDAPPVALEDAQRELTRIAARAYGVATEPDLRDYWRLPHSDSKQRVAELVEAGELEPVRVEGWSAPAYLCPQARQPRRVTARALLSPFDPLVWFRERTQRVFGFEYRIEIYVPAPQRHYGYYVLPFLLGEDLVARVDLKSDRADGVLRVQSSWVEPGPDPGYVATELAAELAVTAKWLGLSGVEVTPRGDLAGELAAVVRAS